MVQQLLNHIQRHNLCKTTDKILLAVSGGVDSMVMLDLFRHAGFNIGVAHCNFQLRGEESDADERLVKVSCSEAIPFHAKRFDTKGYAWELGISIQMAARELRYEFFKELLQEHHYQFIATAHHLNDALETVMLNFIRGSGIEGMTGIPFKNNQIIRPMLFATRDRILQYATTNNLSWREDSSNASDDYHRNFIRHQIIPRLKEINPNLEETFRNTQERLAGTSLLTKLFISQFQQQAFHTVNDSILISKEQLKNTHVPAVLLWELIKDLEFTFEQCKVIADEHQPGKTFFSATHQLVIDREHLIIQQKHSSIFPSIEVEKYSKSAKSNLGVMQFLEENKEKFQMDKNSGIAHLDADKIDYPLLWRSWKPGDSFIPLGMSHSKKLSDFLIDLKIPLPDKEKITVLESAGKIIWVVGLRIHDHYKVTDQTRHILTVRFREE